MIKIVLVCAGGMSTSMMMERMKKEADQRGLETEIIAVGESDIKKHIGGAQVLLLGPQVRYALAKFKQAFEPDGVKVDVINMGDYGRMNGVGVLDTALKLLEGE